MRRQCSLLRFKIKTIPHSEDDVEEIQEWSLCEILEEINRDRSDGWTNYDASDWREGWNEWVEGESYTLVQELKVGDIVTPYESDFVLHCASGMYNEAVVISTKPFVLTSKSSDMRWESTVKVEDFRKVDGELDDETLQNCMRRL